MDLLFNVDDNLGFTPIITDLMLHTLKPVATSEGVWCFSYTDNVMIVLWNPSIKRSVGVSVPSYMDQPDSPKMVLGFGVRPDTLDPTILKINYPYYGEGPWYVSVFTLSSGRWTILDSFQKFKCMIHFNAIESGVIMYNDMTYSFLVEMLVNKFELNPNKQLSLSYRLSPTDSRVEINDDNDVRLFVTCACESTNSIPHLYIYQHEEITQTMDQTLIIPGPAGILQAAKLRKFRDITEGSSTMPTQDYVKKVIEDASEEDASEEDAFEDDHFTPKKKTYIVFDHETAIERSIVVSLNCFIGHEDLVIAQELWVGHGIPHSKSGSVPVNKASTTLQLSCIDGNEIGRKSILG
ncbi:F-box associated interaction domain-containing protein [Artemisia annua]|uniref:F-box associated interaction domain-containing protein n=1 Tax=Artemisia annua TaxID=35608 RepID=A0A2U1LS18_ARTAN|nr:F-box associated interaction domain-containing protein [Artemisia annua]